MARDPGEWYDEKRQEAEAYDALVRYAKEWAMPRHVLEALERLLERARDVGD